MRRKMIPDTFIQELANRASFVIHDNRLYQIDTIPGKATPDILRIGSQDFCLIPSSCLEELDAVYRDINKEAIFNYKRRFIEQKLDQEMKTEKEIKRLEGKSRIMHFLFNEFFPLYNDREEEIEHLLDGKNHDDTALAADLDRLMEKETGKVDVSEKDIQKLKEEIIHDIRKQEDECAKKETQKQKQRALNDDDPDLEAMLKTHYQKQGVHLDQDKDKDTGNRKTAPKEYAGIRDVLRDRSYLIFRGAPYELRPADADKAERIILDGKTYALAKASKLGPLEEGFRRYYELCFKIESVEECGAQLRRIQEMRQRNQSLGKLAKLTEYEVGDVGFIRKNDDIYAYVRIPKFAMKHPKRNDYYAFEGCRVGVELNFSDGEVYADKAVIIDAYAHPFLRDAMEPFQHICNLAGSGNYKGLTRGETIAKKLADAKNVFIHGMTQDSFRSHNGTDVDDSYYWGEVLEKKLSGHKMSEEQVRKQGYMITNVLWKYVEKGR